MLVTLWRTLVHFGDRWPEHACFSPGDGDTWWKLAARSVNSNVELAAPCENNAPCDCTSGGNKKAVPLKTELVLVQANRLKTFKQVVTGDIKWRQCIKKHRYN